MKTEQALQILKEALHIAIAKGCFGLVEVTNVVEALKVINESEPSDTFEELN